MSGAVQLWRGAALETVIPSDHRIAFNDAALQRRDTALDASALIGKVETAEQNQKAVLAQTMIADLLRESETARKAIKAPIIDAGRKVEAVFDAFLAELKDESMRLARVTGDFLALEAAKARAAQQAQRMELERVEKERISALARAQKEADDRALAEWEASEKIRKERETRDIALQQALASSKNHERMEQLRRESEERVAREQKEAKERQERLAKEQEERRAAIDAEAKAKAVEVKEAAPVSAPARAVGQAIKIDWKITVNDPYLLFRHHPNFVDLHPRIADIKAAVKAGIAVAGVTAERVTTSVTRKSADSLLEV